MPHDALSLFSTLYLKNELYDLNHSAYLGSVLVFEVLTSVFTWIAWGLWPLTLTDLCSVPQLNLCHWWSCAGERHDRLWDATESTTFSLYHCHRRSRTTCSTNERRTQPKTSPRSLKTHTEMIVRAVEALCCAQTWIKCHRDGQIWPAGQVSGFIHDCEVTNEKVFVFVCEWLKFMSSMDIIFWRADDLAFSFTFI